ncbi:fad dependent oxidoreductase [Shewanella decolorationis S12]|uniref:Fad dependent oxidoreductase n=2 Tax=Shewanella decolorationis TaxID=256839 RepID=A0ABN0PJ33_9GAMM|nr:fad dependent oxidoreductase [Shewanella decolorationis S12]GLR34204.1 FAD-dependent oxidoreductase [Shewanella decolorationis]
MDIDDMSSYDIAIIGGGISGVGIAQYAAAAGYSTLLIEKGEIGGQTSANSSKLIHGGLRYLESGQVNLVRKSLQERRHLLDFAPSLVKAVPFYIPVYQDSHRNPWTIRAGLSLYALLSEFDPLGRFVSIPAVHWHRFNGLKLQGLKAVFQYWDAQTDDKLLTQAVARSAEALGAHVYAEAEFLQLNHLGEQIDLSFRHRGEVQQIEAKLVINAAGPWVNEVLAKVSPPLAGVELDWVQGAHLLLDLPAPDGILYLESCFDKRVIFVMPWYGQLLIGTTETELTSIDTPPQVTESEINYLLGIYRHYFPLSASIDELKTKIVQTFCGVRVLPKQASSAFERPRDTLMQTSVSHPRLLSLYGGKLTTFRSTSAEVLEWVEQKLGKRTPIADVDSLRLS